MMSYRTILAVVTVLSLLVAGLGEIRNSLILTVGLMNLCLWTFPIIQKWKKRRDAPGLEGEGHLLVGNYPEAEQALRKALSQAEHQRITVKKRASLMRNLADAQRKQGKFAEAQESILQVLALSSDLMRDGLIEEYGLCLELLAAVHQDTGNHPQEQQVLQESLRLEEGLAKPNQERLAKRRQKLALAYHNAGDYAAAAPHFARSLELHEQAFGPNHAETGKMLTELGASLQREGKYAEAARNLERAMAIQARTLGADSPELTESLYHLALAHEKSGNLEQAAAQFESMLQRRERQVGGSEAALADAYHQLAKLSLKLGQLARAREAAQSAIFVLEREPGIELASALETLGAICEQMDRSGEAADAFEKARELRKLVRASRREASA
jgi:tetratricopeptide (TPR) repeat protein